MNQPEYGCVLRRGSNTDRESQPPWFKLRIVAGHITLQAMRFETSFSPDPVHGVFADFQSVRQFAATPMRGPVAGFLARGRTEFRPNGGVSTVAFWPG